MYENKEEAEIWLLEQKDILKPVALTGYCRLLPRVSFLDYIFII
ncbi:hypothetical protein Desde_0701 [Desulfitobacterium dehalogenans ATCC 51507]|uniref:Uncharacterized protein n=1 Tax=Desulfitobacterium dehalogenans (strain ATCC 51507 / DSM 9161 / JW/IU-DC1) TaxID=756499 RepID=I4A5B4_DESDJ|nr:hypothetical protein Desde_0701 [Desulfitobacterium dehalogenans ATCC 51507]